MPPVFEGHVRDEGRVSANMFQNELKSEITRRRKERRPPNFTASIGSDRGSLTGLQDMSNTAIRGLPPSDVVATRGRRGTSVENGNWEYSDESNDIVGFELEGQRCSTLGSSPRSQDRAEQKDELRIERACNALLNVSPSMSDSL